MKKSLFNTVLALVILVTSIVAQATTFKVHSTGVVEGYFLGATAQYTNRATLNFEDGMPENVEDAWIYNTSPVATDFNFGIHEKDAAVVFVNNTVEFNDWWYSEKSFNNDNQVHMWWNQIYLEDGTPAIIVRWEDGTGLSDFNDHVLLFTNIIAVK